MAKGKAPVPAAARSAALVAVGYGAVCGLIFPLMISGAFLQQVGLTHGAGNSFGLVFFCAYTAAMLAYAVGCIVTRRNRHTSGDSGDAGAAASDMAFESPRLQPGRWILPVGLALALGGNCLMLARQLGMFEGGWLYTGLMGITIGCGLALAELGWMRRLAHLGVEGVRGGVLRIVSASYAVGCVVAACIFAAAGMVELSFAPAIIVASLPLVVRSGALDAGNGRTDAAGLDCGATSDAPVLAKAIIYLAVVSFVFGALSQASAAMPPTGIPIEALALIGIALAAAALLVVALRRAGRAPDVDLYWVLFPVVAVALVALPFVDTPALRSAATVSVFMAFYATGINTRVVLCRLAGGSCARAGNLASVALGAGGLAILLGVWFGANVLTVEEPAMGLVAVALASLFVLALSPLALRAVERRTPFGASSGGAGASLPNGPATVPADYAQMRERRMREYAAACGMTAREAEVLALLCSGRTRTYIAAELGLSPNTVKGYIHAIYQKAGALDKQDLIDRVEQAVQES